MADYRLALSSEIFASKIVTVTPLKISSGQRFTDLGAPA
jgi:hypothetical protein